MALIKCPECGREISDKAVACIHCGYPIATQKLSKENTTLSPKDVIGTPNLDDAFDSLQKLYQMGFIGMPTYNVWEIHDHEGVLMWHCECRVNGKEKFYQGDFYSKDYGKEVTAYQMILDILGLEENAEEFVNDEQTSNEPPVQKTTEQAPKQAPAQKTTEQAPKQTSVQNATVQPQKTSQPQQPLYKKWWFWLIVVWLSLGLISAIFGEDSPDETPTNSDYSNTDNGNTSTNNKTNNKGSKDNPYVLNADEWYTAHCKGTINQKYIDKWVKITGTVLNHSNYSNLTGYYLAGGTGCGLVCWVDDGKVGAKYGQVIEYIGKVTVEDSKHIEISDGQITSVKWPTNKPISPVTISEWTWTRDSFGGVEWNFKLTNNTDKTIKYVTLEWDCYNAVGDLVYDEITSKSSHGVKFTGPLEPKATTILLRNTTLFYSYSYNSASLTKLKVEFTDGTIICVTSQGYSRVTASD